MPRIILDISHHFQKFPVRRALLLGGALVFHPNKLAPERGGGNAMCVTWTKPLHWNYLEFIRARWRRATRIQFPAKTKAYSSWRYGDISY
mmetsp:Transcript_28847/g.54538  ORF Transcript_28847/g.54538 Transcript_28847/m.54538 type:complete len:90 (-) Transcript_28847:30-299(-)